MIRIMITGNVPRIGKTALICKLLKVFSGYAVIQVKKGFFTSITSEPEGEEPNLFKSSGAIQVIEIQADPEDVADAMDQALCLLPLQIERIIIEGNLSFNNFHADIVIFLTDAPPRNLDSVLKMVNIIVLTSKSKGDIKWKDYTDIPVFFLDMQDIDEEEWKRFMATLTGLTDSMKSKVLGH